MEFIFYMFFPSYFSIWKYVGLHCSIICFFYSFKFPMITLEWIDLDGRIICPCSTVCGHIYSYFFFILSALKLIVKQHCFAWIATVLFVKLKMVNDKMYLIKQIHWINRVIDSIESIHSFVLNKSELMSIHLKWKKNAIKIQQKQMYGARRTLHGIKRDNMKS